MPDNLSEFQERGHLTRIELTQSEIDNINNLSQSEVEELLALYDQVADFDVRITGMPEPLKNLFRICWF